MEQMTVTQAAMALNEWMRRFIADPKCFQREFEAVEAFLAEQAAGKEPSYGEVGAAYMQQLLAGLSPNS